MANLRFVLLSATTFLASIMVIGPHHAAVTHVVDSSEVGQREHMVRPGILAMCTTKFQLLELRLLTSSNWNLAPKDLWSALGAQRALGDTHLARASKRTSNKATKYIWLLHRQWVGT